MLDTQTDEVKTLKVNGYEIKVKSTASTAGTSSATQGQVQTQLAQPVQSKEVIVEKKVEVQTVAWWMLVFAFVLGVLSMYLLRFIPSKKAKPYKESEALKILYGHMGEDEAVEEMVRKLYAKKNGDKSVEIDKKLLKELLERFR